MSTLAARLAYKYASSNDYEKLRLEWANFSGWHFEYLEKDLETLEAAVGSPALQKRVKLLANLGSKYRSLVTKYGPQIRSVSFETLPKFKQALLRELRFWTHLDRMAFTDDDVYDDVTKSQAIKAFEKFPRDLVIDRIIGLPEDFEPKDLDWLKQIDIAPFKKALADLRKHIPDFPGPEELGSYEYFERWRADLPADFDSWEDALPNDFAETLPDMISETGLGKRLYEALDGKGLFWYVQDSANSLADVLDALKV